MITLKCVGVKLSLKLIKNGLIMRYRSTTAVTYQDAIKALNNLQSNAQSICIATKHNAMVNQNLDETRKYVLRCGIDFKQLDELSVIHVAGTKGKGSTCAYIEAILREHGYKTGLYTSPHLVSVCERLMINGQPIDEDKFAYHFWKIYEKLMDQREYKNDMPAYFKFITIMMFNIFIMSSVDVAVIEVGIGGEYDCTNIIRNPTCVGISKLDLDHIALLGDNLKAIAYQKSGIFKKNVPAFTVPQLPDAMSTLFNRAIEKNCNLNIVPPISDYKFNNNPPNLGIPADIQYYNASLAIELSNEWIKSKMHTDNKYNSDEITLIDMNKVEVALKNCKWPGRTQLLRGSCINFYLDGAHTLESMYGCIEWFKNATNNSPRKRVLMFNVMGNRNAFAFLNILKLINFHSAFFVPNVPGIGNSHDQDDKLNTIDHQVNVCVINCRYWGDDGNFATSVNHALNLIKQKYQLNNCIDENYKIDLLITGSLHLVGAALTVLDPKLTMSTDF